MVGPSHVLSYYINTACMEIAQTLSTFGMSSQIVYICIAKLAICMLDRASSQLASAVLLPRQTTAVQELVDSLTK